MDELQEKIGKLQMLEQNMHNFLMQKQQFQSQLVEIDSALKELKDAKTTYKIVGNIMVSSNKENLETELKEKKERMELRIKTIEKQESQIKEKASSMQAEVMKQMEGKQKD